MAALGLNWGEVAFGTTVYTTVRELELPKTRRARIIHSVSKSTKFPSKDLGFRSETIEGVMKVTGANLATFVTDLLDASAERKISFVIGTTEAYVYAYGGDLGRIKNMTPYGSVSRVYEVDWSFPLSRSIVYKASDDSTLWGAL